MRHVVLCRKSQATPHHWVTLEFTGSTEDGPSWSPVPDAPSDFKTAVYKLLDRLSVRDSTTGNVTHIEPGHMPAVTISQRDEASIMANPPLVGDHVWKLSSFMLEQLGVTVLAPLHYEGRHPGQPLVDAGNVPPRTRFEMWSRASRSRSNWNIFGGRDRFIARELRAAVLRYFQDANEERPQHAQELYRGFALNPEYEGLEELYIRPSWQLVQWPDIAEINPPPKPTPTRSPELIAQNQRSENVARIKRNNERIHKSLGRTFNPKTRSWG